MSRRVYVVSDDAPGSLSVTLPLIDQAADAEAVAWAMFDGPAPDENDWSGVRDGIREMVAAMHRGSEDDARRVDELATFLGLKVKAERR